MTPIQTKIRTLAGLNAPLLAALGTSPFRWCDMQLVQGYLPKRRGDLAPGGGTSSVRARVISTVPLYTQQGRSPLEFCRVQLDVLDLDPDVCRQTAFAVVKFLGGVNLMTGDQFGSPAQSPANFPTFTTGPSSRLEPQPGTVVYVEMVEVTCWNSTAN